MKKFIVLLLCLLSLSLTACPGAKPTTEYIDIVPANVVPPGQTRELAASFIDALQCSPTSPLVWSYSGTIIPSYSATLDGQVSQTGTFIAPSCGSILVGTTVTVSATCTGGDGVVRTGTASLSIPQELLNSMGIAAAVVFPGTPQACLAHTPTHIIIPIGAQIQFYALMTFTCTNIWSPSTPPTVGTGAGQLPQCSLAVSP